VSATARAVLDVARSQLGVREEPRGSNDVVYSRWWGLRAAWCAMFVSWCAWQAKATDIIPRHCYTPSGANWFKKAGRWHTAGPKVGDLVYFEWPHMGRICHVGLVEAVRADGSIVTLEGNTDVAGGRTGGMVMRHARRAFIAGYGRPAYTIPVPRPTPTPRPLPRWYRRQLRRGMRGLDVRAMQRRLGLRGTGFFGPRTNARVVRLQRARRVSVDGVVGPITARLIG